MGAILNLKKMPSKCSECYFLDYKDKNYCHARQRHIIMGKTRPNRMPLCPLENEGEYMARKKLYIKKYIKRNKSYGT